MDGNVNSMILAIAIHVTINSSKNLDKDRFVFTVASQSIPKFSGICKKSFPWNLALVNKQMWTYKFTEKDLYSRGFAWNKLKFYRNYFHQHLPEKYPGPMQTFKIEKFAIIADI